MTTAGILTRQSDRVSTSSAVSLDHVVKFFGRFAALKEVSGEFARERLYVILGDNGAGKSTLVRVITGLLAPSSGAVRLLGADPKEARSRIGYMGHASFLYDELTAMENLRYFGGLYAIGDDGVFETVIRLVGLDPALDRRVGQYSQGMRQRLSLARALVHQPEVLFLDEPFSNVDQRSAQDMASLLGEIRDAGRTVFVVTHQPAVLAACADEFVVMDNGRIVERRARGVQ